MVRRACLSTRGLVGGESLQILLWVKNLGGDCFVATLLVVLQCLLVFEYALSSLSLDTSSGAPHPDYFKVRAMICRVPRNSRNQATNPNPNIHTNSVWIPVRNQTESINSDPDSAILVCLYACMLGFRPHSGDHHAHSTRSGKQREIVQY